MRRTSAPRFWRRTGKLCSVLFAIAVVLQAKEQWISVQTPNFYLIGNASDHDIRKVAEKMEQFRDAVTKLFSNVNLSSSVPTTVLVFKADASFRPFKPQYQGKPMNIAGYFLQGMDVNYIALTSEVRETNPYAVIFHEYVHSLTTDGARHVPLWFYEGLAEYYSTFEVTDGGGVVTLGVPIANHVLLLRENKFLPFSTLVAVNHDSPHYNESSKQGIFYAESWALTHYLMLGEKGRRNQQLAKYLRLLRADSADEDAFEKAFETDFNSLEKEVRTYIGRNTYPVQTIKLKEKLQSGIQFRSVGVSEAVAHAVLGDLLLHNRRFEEAEKYLLAALQYDPDLAGAHASLGALRMQQDRWQEATEHLEKAVVLDSKSYIAHYNYARLLLQNRPASSASGPIAKETVAKIRQASKRSIELRPTFAESYRLLAHSSQISGEELEESLEFLQRAKKLIPGREDLDLDIAGIYLRKKDLESARRTLLPVAKRSAKQDLRVQAEQMLRDIESFEQQQALLQFARDQRTAEEKDSTVANSDSDHEEPPRIRRHVSGEYPEQRLNVLPKLQVRGNKLAGVLVAIDCPKQGVFFIVKEGARSYRFYASEPEKVLLYDDQENLLETMEMACGPRKPTPVVITFRPPAAPSANKQGDVLSIQFAGSRP